MKRFLLFTACFGLIIALSMPVFVSAMNSEAQVVISVESSREEIEKKALMIALEKITAINEKCEAAGLAPWFLEVINIGEEKVDHALKFFPTLVELGKALELFANPASDFKKAVSAESGKALAEIVEDPETLAYAMDRIKNNTPQSRSNGQGLRRSKRLQEEKQNTKIQ